jgi:hypothetical protein
MEEGEVGHGVGSASSETYAAVMGPDSTSWETSVVGTAVGPMPSSLLSALGHDHDKWARTTTWAAAAARLDDDKVGSVGSRG